VVDPLQCLTKGAVGTFDGMLTVERLDVGPQRRLTELRGRLDDRARTVSRKFRSDAAPVRLDEVPTLLLIALGSGLDQAFEILITDFVRQRILECTFRQLGLLEGGESVEPGVEDLRIVGDTCLLEIAVV